MEFEATLVRLPGKIAWTVFYVPASFTAAIGTKGRINVRGTVDEVVFRGTLLPSRNGHYQVYNQAMRGRNGKGIGETVYVTLDIDHEPRELEIPEDVATALANNLAAQDKFAALPAYQQRETLIYINSAKTQPTREKRITALIVKLQNNA